VHLCQHAFNGHGDDVWEKFGQGVGNLQALERLRITTHYYDDEDDIYSDGDDDDDEVVPPGPIPDWEILPVARILSHVRQNQMVSIDDKRLRTVEDAQVLARAIHGHPNIKSFCDRGLFPYESLDTLFSTLTTLPALESVSFGAPEVRKADESTLVVPESLTELLRVPILRFVRFRNFSFTCAILQALVKALIEGTAVTRLEFNECSFPAEESTVILANGISRNTSVVSISVAQYDNNGRALFDALARALTSRAHGGLACGAWTAHSARQWVRVGRWR
jgi:hypothetical protein